MDRHFVPRVGISGSVSAAAIALGLALLAKREGKRPLQPLNATSHWLHGDHAARVRRVDVPHTLVGYLTHHASAIFWAVLLEWMLGKRRTPARIAAASAATAAIAGAVDYGIVPKRLTPGWENVVSKRSVALSFAVMAAGFVLGAALAGSGGRRR